MKNFFQSTDISFDDFITGNKFIDICEETKATFCKTDFIKRYSNTYRDIFVTHNSDYPITDEMLNIGPKHKYWFAQNKECKKDSVLPIPIGLENMRTRDSHASNFGEYASVVPSALQKAQIIERIGSFHTQKAGLVYMNFNINTYPQERKKVWDMFSDSTWVNKASSLALEQFYFELASHKFVISPRGNGLDCHRTWEALYLKTIPIVKRSPGMSYFEDLPIYFVDSWKEVTEQSLNSFYENMLKTKYDLGKIKISWWHDKIKNLMRE